MRLLVLLLLAGSLNITSAATEPESPSDRLPAITPEYIGVEIPPNIAPLNFHIAEPAIAYRVEMSSGSGRRLEISSKTGDIKIPRGPWRVLLQNNRGKPLSVIVSTRSSSGEWTRFKAITNHISKDDIDSYLAYRRLHPVFTLYGNGTIGIFQRNLESFEESPILEVKERSRENHWCMNCHTFLNHKADTFSLHLRNATEKSMLLVNSNVATKLDMAAGYMSWHPSGKLVVLSQNKLSLFVHSTGETRDVFDANSDLVIYRLDSNSLSSPAPIAQPGRMENWPMWSQDGAYLYFCSATPRPFEEYKKIRYDLMRVRYDATKDIWDDPETLLSGEEIGRSLVEPRPSPDGRFLVFTACDYGHFPVYQTNSALHIMDLQTRRHWPMELNSGRGETWHCWSANGRWLVFSSKRLNRLTARPFFSHVDSEGHASKPFVLPQEDPLFYDTFLKTFNVPELLSGPVPVSERLLLDVVAKPPTIKPTGAKPVVPHQDEGG